MSQKKANKCDDFFIVFQKNSSSMCTSQGLQLSIQISTVKCKTGMYNIFLIWIQLGLGMLQTIKKKFQKNTKCVLFQGNNDYLKFSVKYRRNLFFV